MVSKINIYAVHLKCLGSFYICMVSKINIYTVHLKCLGSFYICMVSKINIYTVHLKCLGSFYICMVSKINIYTVHLKCLGSFRHLINENKTFNQNFNRTATRLLKIRSHCHPCDYLLMHCHSPALAWSSLAWTMCTRES